VPHAAVVPLCLFAALGTDGGTRGLPYHQGALATDDDGDGDGDGGGKEAADDNTPCVSRSFVS
jgi:hypothetical protein